MACRVGAGLSALQEAGTRGWLCCRGSAGMTAVSTAFPVRLTKVSERPSFAVRMLQVYSVALLVFPANFVVKAVGAEGYAAALVSYAMLMVWFAGSLLAGMIPLLTATRCGSPWR